MMDKSELAAKNAFFVAKAERERCEQLEQDAREALEECEADVARAREREYLAFVAWKETWSEAEES